MDTNTILIIAAIIGVFIFLRELQTWFWKIDKRIEIQKEQTELLSKILYELKHLEFKFDDEVNDIEVKTNVEEKEEPIEKKKKWSFFITDENETK